MAKVPPAGEPAPENPRPAAKPVRPAKAVAPGAVPANSPAASAGKPVKAAKGAKPEKEGDAKEKKRRKHAIGVREELEEMKEMGTFGLWIRDSFRESPAIATSAVVHMIVLLLLFFVTLAPKVTETVTNLVSPPSNKEEEKLEEISIEPPTENLEVSTEVTNAEMVETDNIAEVPEISTFDDTAAPPLEVELASGLEKAPREMGNKVGSTTGKGLEGRGAKARAALVAEGGGSSGSEAAVANALKWIAAHQMPDGGWDFDHGKTPLHKGPVNDPGAEKSRAGAASMALLPFLGAGQTHMEGDYKDLMRKGLYFLGSQMKVTPNGGDFRGAGNLYSHGLAAIVLCEAYALTQDKALMAPAQQSLNFITFSQDKTGGGWRYTPGQPGDVSAAGWQIMALKSGHLAYLVVDKRTVAGAINFLNITQSDGGAYYGYLGPGKGPATTGVGLLCRMYLGWKKEEPALRRGVEYLSKMGPSKTNMYYNYYATQVMRHYGGEEWTKWNSVMRDQLVNSQVAKGTAFEDKGSWTPGGKSHTEEQGGRLCETSLATLTLEVYYRHLPLFKEQSADDDF